MAKAQNTTTTTSSSTISKLLPLIILLLVLSVAAFIGYAIFTIVNDVADKTAKKMEKKHNVVLSKDGMKVGVKELETEKYVSSSQRYVWNFFTLFSVSLLLGWSG